MSLVRTTLLLLLHGAVAAVAATALDSASPYFHIRVIDGETGEGVPLVLLRTGNYLELYTDSAGNAGRYGEGDLQWMTAGAGIVHGEMFPCVHEKKRNPSRFFQIWLNLPAKDKFAKV